MNFSGRYRCDRLLKDALGVKTFAGIDSGSGEPIVVRVVPTGMSEVARARLEHQARVLRQVGSSTKTAPLWFSEEREGLVLVSPFIPGITLAERLAQGGSLGVREALAVARSVLGVLADVHAHGVVHQDIKPSNIIVDADGPLVRATLIDFGLAVSNALEPWARGERAGTALYVSPEQAGLLNQSVDGRSDLYSLGVVLYEALSGTSPFADATVGEVLRNHLTRTPPRLAERGVVVPRALDEIVYRLMRKDPRDRYQTAEGVLRDINELRAALDAGDADPAILVGAHDRHLVVTEPSFVGRKEELSGLAARWDEARRGNGGIVLLEAESGGGKTRLLEELAKKSLLHGARVYWGRGLERAAQRPFQVLVGVADQVVRDVRADSGLRDALAARLGDFAEAAVRALPELGPVFPAVSVATKDAGPEDFGEVRNVNSLVRFLGALGGEARPALVLLDDCQWADRMTLSLVQEWQRGRSKRHGKEHVLVVVAFRSEEVPADHVLRAMGTSDRVLLPPLRGAEQEELVHSMAGVVPEEIIRVVAELSGGSPFMASAVVRGLVESGAMAHGRDGWALVSGKVAKLQSSRQSASFLVRRLELLPENVQRLLAAGAVLGKEFDLNLAARLASLEMADAIAAAEEASKRHIVWQKAAGGCGFVHDKLREAMLDRLLPGDRKALHLMAAETIEAASRDNVFELAFHFDAAGEGARALPYALAGAEKARAQHSLELAEQQYRIAERAVPPDDRARRRQVMLGLGDTLLLKGDYDAAEAELGKAFSLSGEPVERARIEGKLGELAFKRGNVAMAAEAIERALKILGRSVPTSSAGFLFSAARQLVVQAFHTLFPRLCLARRRLGPRTEREFTAIRLLSRLAYIYWFQRGKIPCLWAHVTEMNLAERYPPTSELAQAYSEHAPVMTMVPWFSRGVLYAQKSLAIRRGLGDQWGEGQSLNFYGVVLYSSARYRESIEKCREAVRLLERAGDQWEVNTAKWHIGFAQYRLGELDAAVETCREVYRAGLELGDHQATAIGLAGWVKAAGGNVSGDLIRKELDREADDAHSRVELLQAYAIHLIAQKRYADAVESLRLARARVRKSGLKQEYVAPVLPWLATAMRLELERVRGARLVVDPGTLTRRALKVARQALSVARQYPNNLPHALRELGMLTLLRGDVKRARALFEESRAVAADQGARQELMLTLQARAQAGRDQKWAGADADWAAAEAIRAAISPGPGPVPAEFAESEGGRATLSLVDRFQTLLDVGRAITSSLTPSEIFTAVRDAGLRLLRGERCLVFQWFPAEQRLEPLAGQEDTSFSRSMVLKAVTSGKQVVFFDSPSAEVAESLILQGVRSAICTPFLSHGRVAGCFYLTHTQVGTLFGREEGRLGEFIAALAGVALDNAESFQRLQKLNRDYRAEIAERAQIERELKRHSLQLARSNADLERFAYVASHDLKEPLRTISNNVQWLERRFTGDPDPEVKECIEFAVGGTRRMYELIDALLTYARSGTPEGGSRLVELDNVLKEAVQNLGQSIEESQATIEADVLPALHVNGIQLMQVFQNLLGNAIRFRGERPPVVRITAERRGEEWLFAVQDNGIGIDPSHKDRIFVIFQRLHDRAKYPGTGVGLAVCKRIIEGYGGRIWVDSTPAKGSTFYFTLPARYELGADNGDAEVSHGKGAKAAARASGRRRSE